VAQEQQSAASVLLLIAAIAFFAIGGMILLGGCFAVVGQMGGLGRYSHPEPGIFAAILGMFITATGIGAIVLRHFLNRPKTN